MGWLSRFMMGRHGVDQLGVALFILYFLLFLIGSFTGTVGWVLIALAYAVILFCIFRMFSRNHQRRINENMAFLKLWNPVKGFFKKIRSRFKDRKTHKYYKCPSCKKTLRVPKGRGKICVVCPVCKHEFIKKT